jgi:NAD(P)H-dependent FMN reductase
MLFCLLRRNTIDGVLKNAIDWALRPHGDSAWDGKPAAIMGATTGAIGTARAQNHLRQILVYLNMFQSGKSATTVRRLRVVSSVAEHLVYTELRAILVA